MRSLLLGARDLEIGVLAPVREPLVAVAGGIHRDAVRVRLELAVHPVPVIVGAGRGAVRAEPGHVQDDPPAEVPLEAGLVEILLRASGLLGVGRDGDEEDSVLGDFLHEERTWNIAHLLENLHLLVKEVRGQYDLYMENFSYGKFVKKLEESNEKFVVRINDTLNKILSQVLALPIAATALNLFAKEKTAIGYVALLFYCALCFVALINQTQVLQHLHDELEDYQTSGKIPQTLTEQWEKQTQKLKKLFKSQRILAILMAITITACAGYAGYALYS